VLVRTHSSLATRDVRVWSASPEAFLPRPRPRRRRRNPRTTRRTSNLGSRPLRQDNHQTNQTRARLRSHLPVLLRALQLCSTGVPGLPEDEPCPEAPDPKRRWRRGPAREGETRSPAVPRALRPLPRPGPCAWLQARLGDLHVQGGNRTAGAMGMATAPKGGAMTKPTSRSLTAGSVTETEPPLESTIQREILLALGSRSDLFLMRRNVGLARDGARVVKFGVVGEADLQGVLAPNGLAIALEVKRPGAKQSPQQRSWQSAWERRGGFYRVVRSVTDAILALDEAARRSFKASCSGGNP
jgi:hypothetical protein